jgi:hypothetical protein
MMEILPMVEYILLGAALISTAATAAFLNQRRLAYLPSQARRRKP